MDGFDMVGGVVRQAKKKKKSDFEFPNLECI
jgi:hypothetical protein